MKSNAKSKIIILFCIIVVTLLHYLTLTTMGGLHDFYRRLYYIPIILAAFRFRLKGAITTSTAIILVYAPHLFLYFGKFNINIVNQLLEIAMFIVVAFITGTLVEKEAKIRRLLEIQILKLTNLENYTHNILDSILNGVIAVDRELRITSINREGVSILGENKGRVGSEISGCFENRKEVEDILLKAMNNKNIQDYETYSIKENGKRITVKLHSYALKDILGESQGMVIIIEDISQVKKLEEHISRNEKLSAIGELASGIAHEIRNPLGIIKTISQTINKDVEDEETREGLQIIEQEINRTNKVIQGLLDFARPSLVKRKIQSINLLMEDVKLLINKYAEKHNVLIDYKCIEDSMIMVDGDKLKQAFINIIFNSIQAMPKGGHMYINLGVKDDIVLISFEDEGVGIKKDKLSKVFEPFYTTKESGTGLGLPITYRIIEEHKGYINIESKEGKGTKIDIYLPLKVEGGEFSEEDINS